MITKSEIRDYTRLKRLNLSQAEREYFQDIILFIIYERFGRELVFKGGTAMNRCYNLNRFSEDLDFTAENIDVTKVLEEGLTRFYIEYEVSKHPHEQGMQIILRLKGPLFMSKRESMCKIEIDLSFREKVLLEPRIETIGRFLKEIPMFDVIVMQEGEILAEKVRAIMTRTRARDVYDLSFLLDRDTKIDTGLIEEKLMYYNMNWDYTKFIDRLDNAESIWKTELEALVPTLPDFKVTKNRILKSWKKNE
ncbi:MAG: nucleotidyl transferase AbiEii/AbiGii toxin family protein [Candidatus Altiarchaeota archaeon]|nr:nucleotidyl transferase AbiEii/AbiGii toxin family protein [Candidatus Altiarchaeota archaeon]